MGTEISKFSNIREQYDKRLIKMEGDKVGIAAERDKLQQLYANVEKEMQSFKKQSDADKRVMESMSREKEILNKNIMRHQGTKNNFKAFKSSIRNPFSSRERPHQANPNPGTK